MAGFEEALARYACTCCEVWVGRGFGDTWAATIAADLDEHGITTVRSHTELAEAGALPHWLVDPEFHRSQQCLCCARIPSTTVGSSQGSRTTSTTSGRYDGPPDGACR